MHADTMSEGDQVVQYVEEMLYILTISHIYHMKKKIAAVLLSFLVTITISHLFSFRCSSDVCATASASCLLVENCFSFSALACVK